LNIPASRKTPTLTEQDQETDMTADVHRIVRDGQGQGGFLAPPGHPDHFFVVRSYYVRPGKTSVNISARERGNGADGYSSVSSVAANQYGEYPDGIVAGARHVLERAELTCSGGWMRMVYGYFRNSYSPDGTDRNVGNAVIFNPLGCRVCGKPVLTAVHGYTDPAFDHEYSPRSRPAAEHHLGYLCVRKYFPDHEPRLDLIADPGQGYGSWPCAKCGRRVQYEARVDALAEVISGMRWQYITECPEGGQHELSGQPE
jgi:hypothetical protein